MRCRTWPRRRTEIVLRNNGRIDINGLLFINGMPYLGMGG